MLPSVPRVLLSDEGEAVSERQLLALMAAIIFTPPTLDEERESVTARRFAHHEALEDAQAILAMLPTPGPDRTGPR